jgi:phosphatidylglycerophosphatase A
MLLMKRGSLLHKTLKDQKNNWLDQINVLYLSFFLIGFLPKAPGTFGSLAAIVLIYLFYLSEASIILLITISVILFILGSIGAEVFEKKHHLHDSSWIVIDEVIGMLICWAFILEFNLLNLLLCFVLFRLFDIAKPFPISTLDKKIKNGAGVMLDDVLAGIFAGSTYWCGKFFL